MESANRTEQSGSSNVSADTQSVLDCLAQVEQKSEQPDGIVVRHDVMGVAKPSCNLDEWLGKMAACAAVRGNK